MPSLAAFPLSRRVRAAIASTALCLPALLPFQAAHAAAAETPEVAQARELIDTFYGDGRNLEKAAVILKSAYAHNPKDPRVYVEAARVTIMGGSVGLAGFETGAGQAYGALLDRAIGLDPSVAKAHILKAEYFSMQGRRDDELRELQAAAALDKTDPWVLMGYGRYYGELKQNWEAYQMYDSVREAGPGTTASQRRAYVQALWRLGGYTVDKGDDLTQARELAALAMKARNPGDGWSPADWSSKFILLDAYDDAITYARIAVKTMKFGKAYRNLALALYAKAAQQITQGKPESDPQVRALVAEAKAVGVPRDMVLADYLQPGVLPHQKKYLPVLQRIVQ